MAGEKPDPFVNGVANDADIELRWAMKAAKYAETYDKVRKAIPNLKEYKMTKMDDLVYNAFRHTFPDLNVKTIIEDELKTTEAKEKWRPFLMVFEGKIPDWNMASLLRIDASKDASEENTMIVPRCQFMVIEIARNREGANQ